MTKYRSPVQYFAEKRYDESETLQDEICFRYDKIRYFDTLERQTMGVNKYASTFRWLHAIRKHVITEKKTLRDKYENMQLAFANTQLWITRLHKYPKAYLGRCH